MESQSGKYSLFSDKTPLSFIAMNIDIWQLNNTINDDTVWFSMEIGNFWNVVWSD